MERLERAVGVRVRSAPIPKLMMRCAAAGEFASWCCETCRQAAWNGIEWGLIGRIRLYGVNADNEVEIAIDMLFSKDSSGMVSIETGGSKTVLEALDGGLGAALDKARREMGRRGLKIRAHFWYHEHIANDAVLLEDARRRLGLKAAADKQWVGGHDPVKVLEVTPGKDDGLSFAFWRARKA